MVYARSRGLPRARFDGPSSPGQGRFRHDRSYSLGTDDGEDGVDYGCGASSEQRGGGARRCLAAAGRRVRHSARWAVPMVLLAGLGGGLLEYQRLMRRAAGFGKAWNPITESWAQFYEGEKRASKQATLAWPALCAC